MSTYDIISAKYVQTYSCAYMQACQKSVCKADVLTCDS